MTGGAHYEITVRGRLSHGLTTAFPGLTGSARSDHTVLCGELVDQSALFGVLAQVESLGLELLGVRCICPPGTGGRPQTQSTP